MKSKSLPGSPAASPLDSRLVMRTFKPALAVSRTRYYGTAPPLRRSICGLQVFLPQWTSLWQFPLTDCSRLAMPGFRAVRKRSFGPGRRIPQLIWTPSCRGLWEMLKRITLTAPGISLEPLKAPMVESVGIFLLSGQMPPCQSRPAYHCWGLVGLRCSVGGLAGVGDDFDQLRAAQPSHEQLQVDTMTVCIS
jgi:hypothetical protein